MNYWGYSTVGFFAPKAGYAATGKLGMQVDEFKTLVKELHKNGIEVILDVVFNHTAEGNERGPDDLVPRPRQQDLLHAHAGGLLLQLQRHAATRSTATTRSCATWCSTACATGRPSTTSTASASTWPRSSAATRAARRWPTRRCWNRWPTTRSSAKCKLIAEAWDAGGLYQVGSFPGYGRWAEWNGKYRDTRAQVPQGRRGPGRRACRQRLQGSPDLYGTAAAPAAVDQLHHLPRRLHAARPGLVQRQAQRGQRREQQRRRQRQRQLELRLRKAPTDDPAINALRSRQMKNAARHAAGQPGRADDPDGRRGRPHPARQQQRLLPRQRAQLVRLAAGRENAELLRFFQRADRLPPARTRCCATPIAPAQHRDYVGSGYPDISWHGAHAWQPDWSARAACSPSCSAASTRRAAPSPTTTSTSP